MINPAAVRRYLKRKLDSHVWMKAKSRRFFDDEVRRLGGPGLVHSLGHHQKIGFLLGVSYPQFCFWYDMGCVDCETEYLSPKGWRRMDQYREGEVAQYWPKDGSVDFVQPEDYVVSPCLEMITFRTRFGVDQKLSPEHKVLYADANDKPRTTSALNVEAKNMKLSSGWGGRFYTTFTVRDRPGLDISDTELRIMVAFVADGSFYSTLGKGCIRLYKKRKKDRLIKLLRQGKIAYEAREETASPSLTNFVFKLPRNSKTFDSWYWGANQEQLGIIAEEAFLWDGHLSRKETGTDLFYSTEKSSADFVQYALVASGRTTSLKWQDRPNAKRLFILNSRKTGKPIGMRRTLLNDPIGRERTSDGKKYCFEVPSGFLVFRRNGCVFLSGNTGKTQLILRLLRFWYRLGKFKKALILVPRETVADGWQEEIERWKIDLPFVILSGSSRNKWDLLAECERGLVIVTYQGLATMVCNKAKVRRKKGQTTDPGRQFKIDPAKIERFAKGIGAIAFDESTNVGNHKSLWYRICNQISKRIPGDDPIRYALAGRPLGRNPMMLWSQFFLVDRGETLGETLGIFRGAFFKEQPKYFAKSKYAVDYKFKKEMDDELSRMMAHRSLAFSADECIDLPKVVDIHRRVDFPEDIQAYYDRMVRLIRKAHGDRDVIRNSFVRMRQLCSGFLGYKDDETGDRAQIEFGRNPIIDELKGFLTELPADAKFLIIHEFTWTGRRIMEELRKLKLKAGWVWSGTKDYRSLKRRFDTDPEFNMVMNWRKGGYGLNLQAADYIIFIESPVSVIDYDQTRRRIIRQGQEAKRVFVVQMTIKDSVQERILQFHKQGDSIFRALIRNPNRVLS